MAFSSLSMSSKVVAISGAGSGIGRSSARLLASLGARLSLADANYESVKSQAEALQAEGKSCIACRVDVTDTTAVTSWIHQTVKALGKLDGAVNCAGIFRKGIDGAPIMSKSDEEWDYVMNTNLTGMFRCLRSQLASMNEDGSVVNVTSTVGLLGLPQDAPYCVSKHGIIGLTRTAAKEMAPQRIRVNCVAPAAIDTPMLGPRTGRTRDQLMEEIRGHTPLNRLGTVEELARTIVFLISSDSSFTTGSVYAVDGGMTA